METTDLYHLVQSHHDELRWLAHPVRLAAERMKNGNARPELHAYLRVLHERLCAHTDFEDMLLEGYLDVTAEGAGWRAADMIRRHRAQRRWLGRAVRESKGVESLELGREVAAMLEALLGELAAEERQVLALTDGYRSHRSRKRRGHAVS